MNEEKLDKKLTPAQEEKLRIKEAQERVAKMKWIPCVAIANVGYPAWPQRFQPQSDRKDEDVFPKTEKGAFHIVKGKKYLVREDSVNKEWFSVTKGSKPLSDAEKTVVEIS